MSGSTDDLNGATVAVDGFVNGRPLSAVLLRGKRGEYRLGSGASQEEQEWLAQEINNQLRRIDRDGEIV